VLRHARWMQDHTQPGEMIPLCMARGAQVSAAMLAALVTGRGFACIDPRLRLPQVEHILRQLRARVVIADGRGLHTLRGEIRADSPVFAAQWAVVTDKPLSSVAQALFTALSSRTRIEVLDQDPTRDPPALTDIRGAFAAPDPHRAACCLFTSGSTGNAKGVLISDVDLRRRAHTEAQWFALRDRDVVLNVLPFSFDIGLNQLLSAVITGAELVVLDSHLPRDVLDTVAERRVTSIAAVPAIWINFMMHGLRFEKPGAHASLRMLTVSGGDLTGAQHQRLPALAPGVQIFKTYGQTEAFRVAALHPDDYAANPASVGRALPGCELRVLRADGSRAAAGEAGEVVHLGTGTMLGYLGGQGDATKLRRDEDRTRPDADSSNGDARWRLHTGDFGVLDPNGFLILRGRRDDMVKIDGNRVYPSEVAALLTGLAGVATAEVIVFETAGQLALAAFVVPNHGEQLESARLRAQLQQRAPGYLVPEQIHVLASMPTTLSGKPDRVHLRTQAESGAPGIASAATPPRSAHGA